MAYTTWGAAVLRYRTRRDLVTRVRQALFSVETVGVAIVASPRSGRPRRVTEREWERSLPLRARVLDRERSGLARVRA